MKKNADILLIGACGYIGSRLYDYLIEGGYSILAIDYFTKKNSTIIELDYRDLTKNDISHYKTIIWLAGSSSVKKATDDPAGAFENNVSGLIRLAQILKPSQRLIYASSASLYSGNESSSHLITEDLIGFQYQNAYDLSKYAFDKLISQMNVNFCGLRFGTVCGTSKNQRHELLLNSMVRSAIQNGEVQVSNPDAKRSVLAMDDLLATIKGIIDVVPESGFYNLASYSMSIGQFGKAVAEQLNAKINIVPGNGTYTFAVDSSKICNALERQLQTPFSSLIDELSKYYRVEIFGEAR
jgi:UDP-glucose 4-epimerase